MTAYLLFMFSLVTAAWCLTYGRAWVARERFAAEMSELADDIEDAVFAGLLPDSEMVEFEWYKAHALSKQPRMVSLSRLAAIHRVHPDIPKRQRSFRNLTAEQRKLFHGFDKRLVASMSRYIMNGSRWWLLLKVMSVRPDLIRSKKHAEAIPPKKLAESYNDVLDRSRVKDTEGRPTIAPQILLAH